MALGTAQITLRACLLEVGVDVTSKKLDGLGLAPSAVYPASLPATHYKTRGCLTFS